MSAETHAYEKIRDLQKAVEDLRRDNASDRKAITQLHNELAKSSEAITLLTNIITKSLLLANATDRDILKLSEAYKLTEDRVVQMAQDFGTTLKVCIQQGEFLNELASNIKIVADGHNGLVAEHNRLERRVDKVTE